METPEDDFRLEALGAAVLSKRQSDHHEARRVARKYHIAAVYTVQDMGLTTNQPEACYVATGHVKDVPNVLGDASKIIIREDKQVRIGVGGAFMRPRGLV